ncbi:MAG TPA: R3H domain-containing nucleic acid-binding protein [Fimbriimonadaceae bacterium]|nr:R3H domain-containing nucleic acid-binding protein [Fimbriimonadaceae bacterium]HRJ97006.1 R3H domain-containing nucleic acid-binding protein [Fimbriimonadaceae bacterium]
MSIFTDGLPQFLDILPPVVRERLQGGPDLDGLIEVVLDYGRPAEVRYRERVDRMPNVVVSEHDIDYVVKSIGDFGEDNRAGIERTLHRISCIRNRQGRIIGLTCRVGRALEGTIDIIDDLVRSGQSILLLGRPGVGKTTKLREVARVLADEVEKRVVIVDTSNEIAGDGDVPHPGIGHARRMQVKNPALQHQVMIEAVENHMPEVIVIDEIGTEAEAQAARTIAERGVQLIGTAHGQTLENLMLNPTLCDLIGGIQAVTLSDDEARRRGTQKTVLERKAPPTFDVVIELIDYDRLAVHSNVQKTVDLILRGVPPRPEVRVRTGVGDVQVVQTESAPDMDEPGFNARFPALARNPEVEPALEPLVSERRPRVPKEPTPRPPREPKDIRRSSVVRIYPYGIARTRLERAIRERGASAVICNDIQQADAIIAIRSTYQSRPAKLRDIGRPIQTVVVKSNTFSQIAGALDEVLKDTSGSDREAEALDEAMQAIETVLHTGRPVDLAPRDARLRKMQHHLAESKRLASESVGEEPQRRLRILPTRLA